MSLLRLGAFLAALVPGLAAAQGLWLPAVFGDHMVLQGPEAVVWGRDRPGQAVELELDGRRAQARAGKDGRWQARLRGLKPGGPHSLVVRGSSERSLRDVLVGEVWLGAGQSNMEWALRLSEGASEALRKADLPRLRLFAVERRAAFSPAEDVEGRWQASDAGSAAGFSAVAWHFGARLQQALDRPVGLVVAAWGGTAAEAWTPRSVLEGLPELGPLLRSWDADSARRELWGQGQAFRMEIRGLELDDGGLGRPLAHAQDPAAWQTSHKPGSQGAVRRGEEGVIVYEGRLQGGAWGSASVALRPDGQPEDLSRAHAVALQARGQGSFSAVLSQASVQDYDYHGVPAFTLGQDWRDIRIPLDGLRQGGWGLPVALDRKALLRVQFNPQVPFWPELPELAYNGMVAPLQPLALAGVLWYQGESNAGRAAQYPALLRAMVGAWRRGFAQPGLPFAVVQLPEFDGSAAWQALQAAQARAVAGLKQAVLVNTEGLGDPQDIHPRRKAEVGQRAFEAVRRSFYRSP